MVWASGDWIAVLRENGLEKRVLLVGWVALDTGEVYSTVLDEDNRINVNNSVEDLEEFVRYEQVK
jgi:hypothetical protein